MFDNPISKTPVISINLLIYLIMVTVIFLKKEEFERHLLTNDVLLFIPHITHCR